MIRFFTDQCYPLSDFPQGGKDPEAASSPSPVGEGWDGGSYCKKLAGSGVRFVLLVLFLFCLHHAVLSQQYYFRKYSVEEGLPNSSVYSFMQDSRGYIWMGTGGGGVSMFDGSRFVTFTTENGLPDNVVRTILEDHSGNVWIGTDNGLMLYDGKSFISISEKSGFRGTSVLKIFESRDSIIWVGTNDGGLNAISIRDSVMVKNFSQEDGLNSDFVYDISESSDGKLWLSMLGGVNILQITIQDSISLSRIDDPLIPSSFVTASEQTGEHTYLVGTRYDGLFTVTEDNGNYIVEPSFMKKQYPSLCIWDILVRSSNEVWLGTEEDGVILIHNSNESSCLNKTNGLPSTRIMNFLLDNEGNTWMATLDQGAVMFRDRMLVSYGTKEGILGNNTLSTYFDPAGNFYIGTEEGLTRFRQDGEKLVKTGFFSTVDGLNDQSVGSMTWHENKLYIGSGQKINILDGNKISSFPLNDKLPQATINYLFSDSKKNLWICSGGGYSKYSNGQMYTMTQDEELINNEVQHVIEDSKGRIWFGTLGGLAMAYGRNLTTYDEVEGLSYKKINCLTEDPAGNIWIGTFGGGIFRYDVSKDTITNIATHKILSSNNINSLLFINDTTVIAGTDKGMDLLTLDKNYLIKREVHYGITDGFIGGENLQNSIARDDDGLIWLGTKNGVVKYDPSLEMISDKLPETTISGVRLFFENVDWAARKVKTHKWTGMPETLSLSYKENHVTFDVTGFFYTNPEDLMFSYILEPQVKEWTPFSPKREIQLQSLSPGHYLLKVKARDKYGMVGNPAEYSFVIKPPFYRTKAFLIGASLFILFSLFAFFRIREKKLVQEKIKLEKIVQERTHEVVEQKNEIEKQRDVVTSQKKEITDSINYAERIQQAVLPDDSILKKFFSDYFIILRPKDIVSGDFYWMSMKNNKLVFTAADCTGHGVPGAFMSMLGVSFLNKIVNESCITEPSAVLNSLRENVISALKQTDSGDNAKDGMDMALCCMDISRKKLFFSGANNPLYMIRNDNGNPELIEIKADTMPVGVYSQMSDFSQHELDLRKGDTIYLFSDGFLDQFGGPDGRKFMKTRFRQMLLDYQGEDMTSQKEIFLKILEEWMNYPSEKRHHNGQIDDIILLGVRV